MPNDERGLLPVLKAELTFLETGGYRETGAQWRPKFLFEDSPTCLNFDNAKSPRPCHDCVLAALVPLDSLNEKFPCRHIPLNEAGYTIDTYYRLGTLAEAEAALGTWLRNIILQLETLVPDEKGPAIRSQGTAIPGKTARGSGG